LRLNEKFLPFEDFFEIYIHNLSNPSFTGTVLTCDLEHELNIHFTQIQMPKRFVPIPITKIYYAIGFDDLNIWDERFHEIIEGLISGGIINYILEKMTKSKWNLMKVQSESEKIVLNLSHLGFGFQICFFALYAAFVIFILEFLVFWVKNCDRTKVSARTEPYFTESTVSLDLTMETGSHEEVFGEFCESQSGMSSACSLEELEMFFGEKVDHNFEVNTKNTVFLSLCYFINQNKEP